MNFEFDILKCSLRKERAIFAGKRYKNVKEKRLNPNKKIKNVEKYR